jgi:hypothetical protein
MLKRLMPVVLAFMMVFVMMPASGYFAPAQAPQSVAFADGPSQTWITFGTPAATWTGTDSNGADLYTADSPVSFNDEGKVVIKYTVSGGKQYEPGQLQDENGNEVAGAVCENNLPNKSRELTISGLSPNTTYRLFWDDEVANQGGSPKLPCDVYLTFTTGALAADELTITGVEEKYLPYHRDKTADVQLLSGIFLRELEFRRKLCMLHRPEKRVNRLAHLKVHRPVLDL